MKQCSSGDKNLNLIEPLHLSSPMWNILNLPNSKLYRTKDQTPFLSYDIWFLQLCEVSEETGRQGFGTGVNGEKHRGKWGITSGKIQENLPAASGEKALYQDQKRASVFILFQVKKKSSSIIVYLPSSSKYNLLWMYKQKNAYIWLLVFFLC